MPTTDHPDLGFPKSSLENQVHSLLENDDQLNDPYSAAIVGIKASLSYGLEHDGSMNDHEKSILVGIRAFLYRLDPMANPEYLAPGITGPFRVDIPGNEEEE